MSRKRNHRRQPIQALPPRGLRPRLARDQVSDLSLVHNNNLDLIARGEGTEELLWQVAAGALTWSRVAERLGLGAPEMAEQLQLTEQLVQRYRRTGRVIFTGTEYQTAKRGVHIMDMLAEAVDRATAVDAADWSEREVNRLAEAAEQDRAMVLHDGTPVDLRAPWAMPMAAQQGGH